MNDLWMQLIASNGATGLLLVFSASVIRLWIKRVDGKLEDLINTNNRLSTSIEVYKESLRHVERRLDNLDCTIRMD